MHTREQSSVDQSGKRAEPGAEDRYTPNHISLDTRAFYLIASSLIIAYSVASLINDDFFIWVPSRRHTITMHLHGSAAWLAAAAAFAAASNLLSVVVDHYDKRNNETNYRAYAKWSLLLAAALLVLALIAHGINSRYPA